MRDTGKAAAARGSDTAAAVGLLRHLAKREAYAVAAPGEGYASVRIGGEERCLVDAVPLDLLARFQAAGWAARGADGAWRITGNGRTRLKRLLSRSPEAAAHEGIEGGAARSMPQQSPCESPLEWLHRRRDKNGEALISDEQLAAGERLRADYWFAGLSPRVTASWSAVAPCSRAAGNVAGDLSDNVLAARERVNRALTAVGPELSGILIDVCCHLIGLEQVEQRNRWSMRSGKIVLQLALTALARHYGLVAPEHARARSRHWGAADYRPRIDPET